VKPVNCRPEARPIPREILGRPIVGGEDHAGEVTWPKLLHNRVGDLLHLLQRKRTADREGRGRNVTAPAGRRRRARNGVVKNDHDQPRLDQIVGRNVGPDVPHPGSRRPDRWVGFVGIHRDDALRFAVHEHFEVLLRQSANWPPIAIQHAHGNPRNVNIGPEGRSLLSRLDRRRLPIRRHDRTGQPGDAEAQRPVDSHDSVPLRVADPMPRLRASRYGAASPIARWRDDPMADDPMTR
jgi:hypothetical protein